MASNLSYHLRNIGGDVVGTTGLASTQHSEALHVFLEMAKDLTASLAAQDRYARLLSAVRRVIPCDAACLMRLEGSELVPLAAHGLTGAAMTKRFDRREHPRLDVILRSAEPVRFPADSTLADPFDGLLAAEVPDRIHACLGCRLTEGGEVVGALTADALEPHAFDALEQSVLAALGALAGAAMRTTALIEALERTARHRGQVARELLRSAAQSGDQILGTSPAVRRLLEDITVVAGSDLAVLITGETGVGKELVARRIHEGSPRAGEALIQVNCAALPESIAESELFGHVAGAFTGATRERAGKFEVADGGTLFLDEIGELPPTVQPKLLRALQQGEIQRVGSDRVLKVNVRILAATNRDLRAEVADGRFRPDLFHRLAVYPIHVPALRERREDIPLLAAHFLDISRRRLGVGPVRLTDEARDRLVAAPWPGNVRELENVISRGVLRAAAGSRGRETLLVGVGHLDLGAAAPAPESPPAEELRPEGVAPPPLQERVDAFRRKQIQTAVERHHGNWAAAARELGLHRSNLHHLARRLGLKVKNH
jgi:anaerobic nitric oxide reductase transcription regulator